MPDTPMTGANEFDGVDDDSIYRDLHPPNMMRNWIIIGLILVLFAAGMFGWRVYQNRLPAASTTAQYDEVVRQAN